jgi:hypothetical protein
MPNMALVGLRYRLGSENDPKFPKMPMSQRVEHVGIITVAGLEIAACQWPNCRPNFTDGRP